MAFDPEHRLVVSVVPGARTLENTEAVVEDFRRRPLGRMMNLITSDEDSAYEGAILKAYGETITPPRTGRPGRPRSPYTVPAAGIVQINNTPPTMICPGVSEASVAVSRRSGSS